MNISSQRPQETDHGYAMRLKEHQEEQLIETYVSTYPHLAPLARSGQMRALGDAVARLAYPTGVTGVDALTISKIGLS